MPFSAISSRSRGRHARPRRLHQIGQHLRGDLAAAAHRFDLARRFQRDHALVRVLRADGVQQIGALPSSTGCVASIASRASPSGRSTARAAWSALRRRRDAFESSPACRRRAESSGPPSSSSMPATCGGLNFSWYTRPVRGLVQRPSRRSSSSGRVDLEVDRLRQSASARLQQRVERFRLRDRAREAVEEHAPHRRAARLRPS